MLYKALIVRENADGSFSRSIEDASIDSLPKNELLVRASYSSLNYKDALSARGHKGITRKYPHQPGIDAAGIVEESASPLFKQGDKIIVTGYDLGMNTAGGFGEYISIPASWAVPLPGNMSLRDSMIYATHGVTAGIAILELQSRSIFPEKGPILVTGASEGVGTLACGILAKAGYSVTAATGKPEAQDMLRALGVEGFISREEAIDRSGRPLLKGRWAGVIENVGGETLETAIRSTMMWGAVCVIGNVSGDSFSAPVYPFILRGVSLLGIDSAERPLELKKRVWDKISSGEWMIDDPGLFVREAALEELSPEIDKILAGGQMGKVIVRI